MEKVRLQKIISQSGICSRRKAEEYIKRGKVTVNGHPAKIGDKADPRNDIIAISGRRVQVDKKQQLYYIMMNKPRG